jgi:bacillithiol system protein YtxJ
MEWGILRELCQIDEIRHLSEQTSVLIYKHSTRCATSRLVLDRLERYFGHEHQQHFKPFFLDLITYRELSNAVAETFHVEHESPQVLLIQHGKSIYNNSHFGISHTDILRVAKNFDQVRQPCI